MACAVTSSRRLARGTCDALITKCSCDPSEGSVMLFYNYVRLDTEACLELKAALEKEMNSLSLRGKIRLAAEGINATCTESTNRVIEFEKKLKSAGEFESLDLKEVDLKYQGTWGCEHVFPDISVRIVTELCPFEPTNRRIEANERVLIDDDSIFKINRLSPMEWRDALLHAHEEEDVVFLDVRNWYESRIGRFVTNKREQTVCAPIRRFNQFRQWIEENGGGETLANKKVYAYCTGGVRCEKAATYLQTRSKHKPCSISVLVGGIVAYARDVGSRALDEDSEKFIGKNVVFDGRGAVEVNNSKPGSNISKHLTNCDTCSVRCLPILARCSSQNCHVILATCSEKYSNLVFCCETCRKHDTEYGGKKLPCECDSFKNRRKQLE